MNNFSQDNPFLLSNLQSFSFKALKNINYLIATANISTGWM